MTAIRKAQLAIVSERMLSADAVRAKCGDISDTTLNKLVKAGQFPQPQNFGGVRVWREADVDGFIRELFTSLKSA